VIEESVVLAYVANYSRDIRIAISLICRTVIVYSAGGTVHCTRYTSGCLSPGADEK